MVDSSSRRLLPAALALALFGCPAHTPPNTYQPPTQLPTGSNTPAPVDAATIAKAKDALVAKHGEAHRARIERGVDQVAKLWRADDGDLVAFVTEQFAAAPADVDALFARFEAQIEQLDGHRLEMARTLKWDSDVDTGPMLPVDSLFAGFDPGAHITEDMFKSKLAFAALLNFPLTTLADRLRDGKSYSRRQWAEVRLTGRFDRRIPGDLVAERSAIEADADAYIADYNLWMHHVLGEDGTRRFPKGKHLISHWNLRDELKANYADPDGVEKQKTIVKVMERIVTQTIPKAVINNPRLDWNPFTNEVTVAPAAEVEAEAPKDRPAAPDPAGDAAREQDIRFTKVLAAFRAERKIDAFAPTAPTYLDRAFTSAEMPEERVRALIIDILESPLAGDAAMQIAGKLGRPLAPQDLWYEFGGGEIPEAELDAETRKRYPTSAAFAKDLPRILRDLGFTAEQANTLAANIDVDASRGAGHAMQAQRRGDKPHLRTRVEPGGMDYKGYNIAIHELGHNVEQYLSLYEVDHTLLAGVPNTAFTEALAFLFQARDLQLLGRPAPDASAERLRVLDHYWNTREIAGSALVEIDVWRWLYDHPDATAAELREATVRISREVWDKYYAQYLHGKGETSLLGIYSHTISLPLYLFNYVLGHCIAFQMEEHVKGKDAKTFAAEFTRVARYGAVLPDVWMEYATGAPVSAKPMLDATKRALESP